MSDNNQTTDQASDAVTAPTKKKSSRLLFGALLVICAAMGVVTLRVNAQRGSVKWVQDLGGNVVYHIERGDRNESLSLDEMKAKQGGFMLNVVGIDYVSAIKAVNLPEGDLVGIEPLSKLSELELVRILPNKITSLGPLGQCRTLQRIEIADNPITDLSPIELNTGLRIFLLNGTDVDNIDCFSDFKELVKVYLTETKVKDLSPLAGLTKIKTLKITNAELVDLKPLESLTNLETLSLAGCKLADGNDFSTGLGPIGELSIESLDLSGTNLNELSLLTNLSKLEILKLDNSTASDITPLAKLKTLKSLTTWDSNISDESVAALKAQLPSLIVITEEPRYSR